jgi:hypothetical protein
MPSFEGRLTDEHLDLLVRFMRREWVERAPTATAKAH